jgi:FkbM family methyltransferase
LLRKFLGQREDGTYVEVGAYDGISFSNTWGLAERGWHGVLIEPVPHLAEACRRNYVHRERIRVIQTAVGDSDKEVVLQIAGALTTANAEIFNEYAHVDWSKVALTRQSVTVQCSPLNAILAANNVPEGFDLLVVDVEGFEAEVFAGFDLGPWEPKMLIVELADTHPDLTATESQDALLGQALVEGGYVIVYKDSINTVFVRRDVWKSAFDLTSTEP